MRHHPPESRLCLPIRRLRCRSVLTASAVPATWAGQPVASGTVLFTKLASLLALTVGALQLLFAFLRAGYLARLVSTPVVVGFTTGAALIIAGSQFATLVGASKCVPPGGGGTCTFVQSVGNVIASAQAGKLSLSKNKAFLASLSCLALLVGWRLILGSLLRGRWRIIANAGPLVLLIVSCAIMSVPSIKATLVGAGIKVGEPIPPGLPPPQLPFPSLDDTNGAYPSAADAGAMVSASVPLAIIGFLESFTIARTSARQYGPYPVNPQAEMLAVGLCNVAVAVGQGYPVTGSFSR